MKTECIICILYDLNSGVDEGVYHDHVTYQDIVNLSTDFDHRMNCLDLESYIKYPGEPLPGNENVARWLPDILAQYTYCEEAITPDITKSVRSCLGCKTNHPCLDMRSVQSDLHGDDPATHEDAAYVLERDVIYEGPDIISPEQVFFYPVDQTNDESLWECRPYEPNEFGSRLSVFQEDEFMGYPETYFDRIDLKEHPEETPIITSSKVKRRVTGNKRAVIKHVPVKRLEKPPDPRVPQQKRRKKDEVLQTLRKLVRVLVGIKDPPAQCSSIRVDDGPVVVASTSAYDLGRPPDH